MTAAAPAKFTFDVDMSVRREKTSVVTQSDLARMLDEARQQGYAEGHAAGENSAVTRSAQAFEMAAATLAQSAIAILGNAGAVRDEAMTNAAELGKAIGSKLAAHMVARMPLVELDALIADCMGSLDRTPHLVIRCNPELADKVRQIAEKHISASGFAGRLVVMGEPDIALGDGRIEWADGGVVRDQAAIAMEIDTIIASWLDAHASERFEETDQ